MLDLKETFKMFGSERNLLKNIDAHVNRKCATPTTKRGLKTAKQYTIG